MYMFHFLPFPTTKVPELKTICPISISIGNSKLNFYFQIEFLPHLSFQGKGLTKAETLRSMDRNEKDCKQEDRVHLVTFVWWQVPSCFSKAYHKLHGLQKLFQTKKFQLKVYHFIVFLYFVFHRSQLTLKCLKFSSLWMTQNR